MEIDYIIPVQCELCLHLFENKKIVKNNRLGCTAFPNGIPDDIYTNKFDHTKPHIQDGGIRFVNRNE